MRGNQAGFCASTGGADAFVGGGEMVRTWFEDPVAVAHYARAARTLGLWRSEEIVFRAAFDPADPILDAGCGAGRIAFGLWRLGFRHLRGVDFASAMIAEARGLAEHWQVGITFHVADLCELPWVDRAFGGVVVGFNGLMQIPGRESRRRAMRELGRVTRSGGRLVFTTHDRELNGRRFELDSGSSTAIGNQDRRLAREDGDHVFSSPEGWIFMHWPDRAEICDDLAATGWRHREDHLRSSIANEPSTVREFADECRFWIADRP